MTLWDLVAVAIRRWIVTMVCVLLTGLAVFWAMNVPPVYLAQVRVVLLRPASVEQNAYTNTSQSLVDLAGVVARDLQGAGDAAQTVSDGVTLAGEGVREGYSVQQPNGGGQWQYRFDEPVLEVQAVDATARAAGERLQLALGLVESTLDRMQDAQGVAPENRVRVSLSPPEPQLFEESGNHTRAVAAAGLAGVIITLTMLGILGPKAAFSVHRRGRLRTPRGAGAPAAGEA